MILVSERAKSHLKEAVLPRMTDESTTSIRLALTGPDQLELVPDSEQEGDQVVDHEGTTVLLIDEELSSQLEGAQIDCIETTEGARLTIQRS